jgi:ectoine hydroxylase-related dioxygenase (phytanoyl-CoA dioxygenase family)
VFHASCAKVQREKYMGDNHQLFCPSCLNAAVDMWTCWIPLSNLEGKQSRLEVLQASHLTVGGYDQPLDVHQDWTLLPAGGKHLARAPEWKRPERVAMGDLILFNFKTVHRANKHEDKTFRLSLDTRVTTSHRPPPAAAAQQDWSSILCDLAALP